MGEKRRQQLQQSVLLSKMSTRWNLPRYKRQWRQICALMPVYLHDGTNGCAIYYEDGSDEYIKARLVWVLNDLLGYFQTNREIMQNQTRQWLGSKKYRRLPLVVNGDFCLVPVHARKTSSRNHGNGGYVVLRHVQDVAPAEIWLDEAWQDEAWPVGYDCTKVLVRMDGQSIEVGDRIRTLRRNLTLAAALVKRWQAEREARK
jgi:hypothetical protein